MALKLPFSHTPWNLSELDPSGVAESWLLRFNACFHPRAEFAELVSSILVTVVAPWWADHLALTWDIRTFNSVDTIVDLFKQALSEHKIAPFELKSATVLPTNSDDLVFVQAVFTFESTVSVNTAIVKLVSDHGGGWKAWTIFTKMQDLKGHMEDRSRLNVYDATAQDEVDILVLGAGQSGVQAAAALRTLGLSCLVVEQHKRVGDQWRQHYDFLKLHLSKWYAQFAYHHWPDNAPFYPTRDDVANFLEEYVQSTHLNVMTSTTIQQAEYATAGYWHVTLLGDDGVTKSMKVQHLVLATGLNGLRPLIPTIANIDVFRGTTMHSLGYKNGRDWSGKKAIVVGTANSGHDVAHDLFNFGASVTMIQRNPTMVTHQVLTVPMIGRLYNEKVPVEMADDIMESTPIPVARLLASIPPKVLNQQVVATMEGLAKAGFRIKAADRSTFIFERFGGHYLNTGTSDLIVSGKIGIKSGIPIKEFTPTGLAFEDGSELPADLVVFATGFDLRSMRETAIDLIGPEEGKNLKEVWGLDDEGNLKGAYRDSGHPNLWYFAGDFQGVRYFSKILALQIKAAELGLLKRYQGGQ